MLQLLLGLQLRSGLGFRFTFNIYYVSTKPTTLSSCITVMLQVAIE